MTLRGVVLANAPFDGAEHLERFLADNRDAGAVTSFTGSVRNDGGTLALELSHYAPLTLPGMEGLAQATAMRFSLRDLLIVHRTGTMRPGEPIVLVAAAAPHRRAAFDAVDYAMDHLKSRAWFWKREQHVDGWHWIEPRGQDHADLARWK